MTGSLSKWGRGKEAGGAECPLKIIKQGRKVYVMSDAKVEPIVGKRAVAGSSVTRWQVIVALGFMLWIPVTLYLLLFAPLPMVHDMVHPVRHAFSFVMCH